MLVDAWYAKKKYLHFLRPISSIYRSVMAIRALLYRWNIFKTTQFPAKVIIVGNLTVGGTGKTPLVIALVQDLRARGYKPGIVSRGYGGKPQAQPKAVDATADPAVVGDEAVLMARKTACPLYVSPNRVAAVKALLTAHDCDVILSDDGLQHLALGRDVEIVVVDGTRYFGNGFCLPAGPLREPLKRLKTVDFIVTCPEGTPREHRTPVRSEAADRTGVRYSRGTILPGKIYNIKHPEQELTSISTPVHAVAAIGNPTRFFNTLRDLGFNVIEHPFPDHYLFRPSDIDFGPNSTVIMTEKDAVKCERFADIRHWCLPIEADYGSMFTEVAKFLQKGEQ